jgi:hypothetical protein
VPWPPQLQDVKGGVVDSRDDAALQDALDAAVAYVEEQRAGDFTFTGSPTSLLPVPDHKVFRGTVQLARRWHNRLNSPDGLVDMGELGTARIPSVDPDIERQLGIGRFRSPMVG